MFFIFQKIIPSIKEVFEFFKVMITGIIASFIYILIQLILLIEFAHSWNESWVERGETNSGFLGGIMLSFISMFGISMACVICMYIYLTKSETSQCSLQKGVISSHLIISILLYIISLLPPIQAVHKASGVLQPSTIFFYTTYLILIGLGLRQG